ncbi:MAG: sulfotransferase [Anaerolineales bacterium]|nr:sulfotransferase [Anaerolineales bacterium]
MIKKYSGYVKEAITYTSFAFRPKKAPQVKFVIYGIPRSGTTLLVNLLNSHPMVHCDGELLIRRLFFPKLYIRCRAKLAHAEVYGFKLLIDHFENQNIPDPADYLVELHETGYKVVSLKRQNLFRAALSSLYGYHRGKFHHTKTEGDLKHSLMSVSSEALLEKIERFEHLVAAHEQVLGQLPNLELFYERDLLNESQHQTTVDRIADYLGIPRAKVMTDLVKVAADDISQFISNADELENYIQSTKYAHFISNSESALDKSAALK